MGKSAIMSVRITGNSDDAVKALSKVTAKASAFGTFMGGAALKGVSALWDTLKGFTSAVMDMSDSTDKFKNTMNFAGFDTSAVEAATKATREYADKTVYDLTTVQNTTAQLAANGIQDYVGLTEAAGNLNAVAGGNAETFKSVAMVMTQTAGAGKLTTENWNQLTDAIPGAAGKLQEAMLNAGAYTGNFREAMEKGEITADEFNKAIMDLGMTDVAKEAATSTQTMEGALGNLEAAVTGGLTDAFNLFKPAVTSAMTVAADKISAFSGKATTGLQGVIKLVRDGDFSSELREAFNIDEDSPVVDFLLTIRDNAVSAFDTAKQKAGEFVAAFQNTGPMQAAADIFGAVWDACKNLAGAAGDVIGQFTPLADSMGGASGAGQALGDAFNGAADIVGQAHGVQRLGIRACGTRRVRACGHRGGFRRVQGRFGHQRRRVRVAGIQRGDHGRFCGAVGHERGHEREPHRHRHHRDSRAGGGSRLLLHADRDRPSDMGVVHIMAGIVRGQHRGILPGVAGQDWRLLPVGSAVRDRQVGCSRGVVQGHSGTYHRRDRQCGAPAVQRRRIDHQRFP